MEAEAVVEGMTGLSGVKDSAKGKAEGSADSDQTPLCAPAQASDPAFQASASSLSITSNSSPAATSNKSDSGQAGGDKPVPNPSLLKGMVFYITDYTQSMDAGVIQKWKQVCIIPVYTCSTLLVHTFIVCNTVYI